jgi:hypothetical protein
LVAVLVAGLSVAFLVTRRRNVLTSLNVLGTIVHEAGHAAMSILTGGGVYRFAITSPDTGVTHVWWYTKLSSVASLVAGYAMPPLAGLGAAALLHRGHAAAVLTITVVTMALLLFVTRDVLTFGSVLLVGVLAFVTLRWGPAWLQDWVAYTEAWLLLTSEIGGLAALIAGRIRGRPPAHRADDADKLGDYTHIPGFVWIAGWLSLIGWGLWRGVSLLWP